MINFDKYLEEVNEGKIILKRKYTENYPEKSVRKGTTVRNTVIEALRDKKLTLSEFKEIVSKHSKSPNKWTQRNKRFFKIEEDNVSLSKYGTKILKTLEPVNERAHDKKSVLKAIGKSDDAMILVNGREYIIYNPDSNNDDNADMWGDKTVFALDQDGGEHEIRYKDIERIDAYESLEVNERKKIKPFKKVKPGDIAVDYNDEELIVYKTGPIGKLMKWDDSGAAEDGLSQGYLDKKDDAIVIEDPLTHGYAVYTYGEEGAVVYESVLNERAKANQMLKDVAKGLTTHVEGIKLSKEMAGCFLEWLKSSTYGKKFSDLPFNKLFTASFNWGLDRYISKDCKPEYKELKQQAKEMKESTIYTSFSNFVNESYIAEEDINEMKEPKCSNRKGHLYKQIDEDGTVECVHCGLRNSLSESLEINEALKSSKLRNLLSMKKSPKDLFKAIYGATKIALDKVEDHQVIDVDPKQGPKQDGYVFYYTTQEKENPHAPDSYYNAKFPANTLLALAKGKKVFYVKSNWNRRGGNTYSLTTDPKGGYGRYSGASDIGPNKSYSGYDASGLGSLARVISISDAAFVINPDALETTHDKIKQRSQAKEGAIAFKDAKEFKDANLARYREILTQRSTSLDVDKEVVKAIEEIADIMKDGIKNKKKNQYNEIIMGTGQDGRDFKINDLTNFTSNLMSDYERWSRYMKDAEAAKERMKKDGADQRDEQWEVKYNEKEAAQYSKSIKDRLAKLKKKNLAW